MEVLTAVVIATLAVVGLAYSFGLGRSFIDRFEVARAALGVVEGRMDSLTTIPPTSTDLTIGLHPTTPLPFVYEGQAMGTESWSVAWFDDPGTAGTHDMKRVTARVVWTQMGAADTVQQTRLFPIQ